MGVIFILMPACDDQHPDTPTRNVVQLPADLGRRVVLPSEWAYNLNSFGHFSFFVTSSSEEVLEDLPIGGRGYRKIEEKDVEPEDAFVEVHVSYPSPSLDGPEPKPLPERIMLPSFRESGDLLGAPLYQLEGQGCNDGAYTLRYWVGPEAPNQSATHASEIVRTLDIGRDAGCPDRTSDAGPQEDAPSACARHDARTIDFNGDGENDWVYLDWIEKASHAEFGWCMNGRHGSMETTGQAETLYVFDLYSDGRHEAFFGGNTCCGESVQVAAFERGRVRVAELSNGKDLDLMSGFWPEGERERWTVYGCEGGEDAAVTQVVATVQGEHLLVRKTRYAIQGARARVVGHDSYTIPDPGKESRGAHVSETVGACPEILEEDGS